MMGEKKYHNLVRTGVDDRETLGFINRQLTETSQIIKHVIDLFKTYYPEVNVHAVNARLSSSMRDAFNLLKIRELNDTHHAYDAFLACTIGCFTDRYLHWLADDSVAASKAKSIWNKMNKDRGIKKNVNGLVLDLFMHDQVD